MSTFRDDTVHARPRTFAFSKRQFGTPGVRTGIHILKRLPGLEYCRPSWNNTETVLRIFPGLCPEDPKQFDTFRVSEALGRYGAWQCCYEVARKFGEPGVTYILHRGDDPHYNSYMQNPAWIIYRAIKDACEKGQGRPEWFPLLAKGEKASAPLSPPTEVVLVQAAVYRHESKDLYGEGQPPWGAGPSDPTVVFEFSKSAADKLFTLLDEEKEDWKGESDDLERFKHGDPVAIDKGVFVHLYQTGTEIGNTPKKISSSADMFGRKATFTKKAKGPIGYDCHLTSTLDGGDDDLPASFAGNENLIKNKCRLWDDILEFMTDQEQAHLINSLFPASAVCYAFRDRPDWILPETKKAATSVSVPIQSGMTQLAAKSAWEVPSQNDTMQLMQRALAGDKQAIAQCQAAGLMNNPPRPSYSPQVEDVAVPQGVIPDGGDDDIPFEPAAVVQQETASMEALEAARQRAVSRSRKSK